MKTQIPISLQKNRYYKDKVYWQLRYHCKIKSKIHRLYGKNNIGKTTNILKIINENREKNNLAFYYSFENT